MKKIVLLVVFAAVTVNVTSQIDYTRQYRLLADSKNREMVNQLLDDWERAEPQNVTMLVGQFNRHVNNVVTSAIGLSVELPPVENYMALTDSLGNTSGYLYEYYATNDSLLTVAIDYVDRAIALAPDRADLYMGKISAWWIAGNDYLDRYTAEVMKLADALTDRKREWQYGEDGTISREEIAEAMQDYCADLFGLNTETALDAVIEVSNKILRSFPKNSSAYSNLGSVAMRRNNPKEAGKLYKKGLRIAPDDTVLLRNATITANRLGRTKDVAKYLARLRKAGNDDDRAWAEKYEQTIKK